MFCVSKKPVYPTSCQEVGLKKNIIKLCLYNYLLDHIVISFGFKISKKNPNNKNNNDNKMKTVVNTCFYCASKHNNINKPFFVLFGCAEVCHVLKSQH